jgi:hypothetical protein
LTDLLFSIISTKFSHFDDSQQTKFIIYLKNWFNKLVLKEGRKKITQLDNKIIQVINLLTSGKILEKNKIFFEDNILINMFTLLEVNEGLGYTVDDISKQ